MSKTFADVAETYKHLPAVAAVLEAVGDAEIFTEIVAKNDSEGQDTTMFWGVGDYRSLVVGTVVMYRLNPSKVEKVRLVTRDFPRRLEVQVDYGKPPRYYSLGMGDDAITLTVGVEYAGIALDFRKSYLFFLQRFGC